MTDVEHFSPETLDEAAALLLAAGSGVRPLANGTDLIAHVSEGQRTRRMVLDMKRIPELNRIDYDERNGLRIGAAVPFRSILEFPPVRRLYPMLTDGFVPIGQDEPADNATLGGSLASPASAAKLAPPLICLRASAAIFGPYGWSDLGAEALLAGAGRTARHPGEFVVDVRLPALPPRANGAYLREVLRGQPALVAGVGAFVALEPDMSTCCGARLTMAGVTPTPTRALEAERFLAGKVLAGPILEEAGDLAVRGIVPGEGSAEECPKVAKGLTGRAITQALERIRTSAHR
jgi:CO/xanthine dehydrogenase FAD-binding subunit